MKPKQHMLTAFMIAVFISGSFTTLYGKDKTSNNQNKKSPVVSYNLSDISLKAISEKQNDLLQWELTNTSGIAYFTIERATNYNMEFSEVASIHPLECADISKNASFKFACATSEDQQFSYYKIKTTYQDNTSIESNMVYIKKAEEFSNLSISEIKNHRGQISLTFNSPKTQNITLNVMDRTGQLLAVKDIAATNGNNVYIYDGSSIHSSEMLIFSLNNNQHELISKKYMMASK